MAGSGGDERATGAADVFVSHASKDAAVANSIVESLERHGLRCWIAPRNVVPGSHYADGIIRAISESKALVLVLSASALSSKHVGKEIERASSKGRPIIALRTDDAPLTPAFEYFLSESQWIDVGTAGIAGVEAKLFDAVRAHLDVPTVAEASAHSGPAVPSRASASRRTPTTFIVVIAALALAGALFALKNFWPGWRGAASMPATAPASAPVIAEKSIAVLPFVDMSEKKDQEYFSDGLSEELIDHLAHAADLKVIARTSSFQFKGKSEDMRTIGQRLGVANLLEGSVRTSGKIVRISVQLVRVSDASPLWSQTYNRDVSDIFKVQDEISAAVVMALKATLAAARTKGNSTAINLDAYNSLLRGRYFVEQFTRENYDQGISSFKNAVRLDPNYAMAWAELGLAFYNRDLYGWVTPKIAYAEARAAVDKAIALDPDLAEAHRLLATMEWNYNFDFPAARREQRRAHELDPTDATATNLDCIESASTGPLEQSLEVCRKMAEKDPLNVSRQLILGWALFNAGRLEEAERLVRVILELKPNFAGVHCALAEVLLERKRLAAALEAARAETDETSQITCMPEVLWALGRHDEANKLIDIMKSKYADTYAGELATWYTARGDKDAAFEWLDRAYTNREPGITTLPAERGLRVLHDDPRWTAFLRRINLQEQ
jgi:adenylate cyclase